MNSNCENGCGQLFKASYLGGRELRRVSRRTLPGLLLSWPMASPTLPNLMRSSPSESSSSAVGTDDDDDAGGGAADPGPSPSCK